MKSKLQTIYFKDFIKLNRGFDLPNDKIIDGDYPVVASTQIKSFHRDFKIKAPGVVTGRSGSLGKVQYIIEDFWPLNTTLYVKDFKNTYPLYANYFLKTMHLENYNSGSGVPTLNQNHLHNMKIKIHDKINQQRLSNLLYEYDKLIENNNKRIELLEKIAQEIYKEWFVRMNFPGHQKAKFNKGIPDGWKFVELKSFGRVVTGKTPSTVVNEYFGGEVPFIKTPDMHGNIFILETDETLTKFGADSQKGCWIPANSICVNCIGAKSGSVSIIIEPSQTNQQIHSIKLKKIYDLEFVYFAAKDLKDTIELFGATGATMTNLSKGKFEKLKILYSDKKNVVAFNSLVSPMFREIKLLGKANINLISTRDLLLPRLMSGEL